jgi:hypothetical protein
MTQRVPESRVLDESVLDLLRANGEFHPVFRVDEPNLRSLACRLRPLMEAAQRDEVRDPLDYLLGALHALFRAHQLGFIDRQGPFDATYWTGPMTRVRYMETGEIRTDGKWLAGFYFNAALARIAAALDRTASLVERRTAGGKRPRKLWERLERLGWGKWCDPYFILPGGQPSRAFAVYAEVNFLKHDPSGRATGRTVSFADATAGLGEILDLTQKHVR